MKPLELVGVLAFSVLSGWLASRVFLAFARRPYCPWCNGGDGGSGVAAPVEPSPSWSEA